MCDLKRGLYFEVADLSPKNIFGNKQAATDGTDWDLNIGEPSIGGVGRGQKPSAALFVQMACCQLQA